ncbi:putative non-specific serine/threonine protein kinase [Helianthus anomalus]
MKFGEKTISCLKHEGIARPTMDEVIWGLELALQLQEDAEETGGMLENQQLSLSMQAERATTDEYVSLGSTGMAKIHDTSPTDTFNEILQSTGG